MANYHITTSHGFENKQIYICWYMWTISKQKSKEDTDHIYCHTLYGNHNYLYYQVTSASCHLGCRWNSSLPDIYYTINRKRKENLFLKKWRDLRMKDSRGDVITTFSHSFTLFWLRKTSMIVEIYQVFVCLCSCVSFT
jgi:hypothetical protein